MSLANVVSFRKSLETDEGLQRKVKGVQERVELAGIATAAGFPCTPEELAAAESVSRFWEAASKDASLKRELARCETLPEDEAFAETARIARAHGYHFSPADLAALSPSLMSRAGSLSDADLAKVSGGLWSLRR